MNQKKDFPLKELKYLEDAVSDMIRFRRVLKYTYAFGYFLEKEEHRNILEIQQGLLQQNCEHLHELIETPLDKFLDPNSTDNSEFFKFKANLENYYSVTKRFCE